MSCKTLYLLTIILGVAVPSSAENPSNGVPSGNLHSLTALLEGKSFVDISPGEFTMGSSRGNPDEQPERRIRITRGFQLGKFEVTQAQWDAVMKNPHGNSTGENGAASVDPSRFKGAAKPVESVSWDEVQQFIGKLNKRDPSHIYRLPTEAEWEYAARAGATGWDIEGATWYAANADRQTHPVGQKSANAWGLHDMIGNVFEWVQDWYAPDAYTSEESADPQGPSSSSYKVYRGCGWLSEAGQCRPSFRGFNFPNSTSDSVGFRLVRTRR